MESMEKELAHCASPSSSGRFISKVNHLSVQMVLYVTQFSWDGLSPFYLNNYILEH